MPNYGKHSKTHCTICILLQLGIAILALAVTLSPNNAIGQTLHDMSVYEARNQTIGSGGNADIAVGAAPIAIDILEEAGRAEIFYVASLGARSTGSASDTVSVISISNSTKIKDIPVGVDPMAMTTVVLGGDALYVANFGSNTVSVINGTTHSKIGEDIPVGVDPANVVGAADFPEAADFPGDVVYVANFGSNTVSVISTQNNTKIKDIPVGVGPEAMGTGYNDVLGGDALYVANFGSNTVSVISTENNTKIGEDIPVGVDPMAIYVFGDALYVANSFSNSISVINTTTHSKIGEDIPVGDFPTDMDAGGYDLGDSLYVANYLSNTVSVINTTTHSKIGEDIPVEDLPMDIDYEFLHDVVYVANRGSDSISVIDGEANKVLAGVTFNVNPFNSGYVVCDDISTPSPNDQSPPSAIGQLSYVYSGAQCTAKPNEGFEFSSWEEKLGNNSTQPISVSHSASTWDSFVLAVTDFFGDKPVEPESKLNITKFGTFTANFREAPPPLPQEFWAQMSAVIATVITALFIPSIVGWFKSKREAKKLNYFHKQIGDLYRDAKLDENQIRKLDGLRDEIADAYSRSRLNEKHYERLQGETSTLYEEILRKKLESISNDNNYSGIEKPREEQLAQVRNEIEYTHTKGKLSEKHYESLRNETSTLYEEIFRKKIDALNSSDGPASKKTTGEQLTKIRSEIKYAFSKGKINEKHYALLNEDISKLYGKEGVNTS